MTAVDHQAMSDTEKARPDFVASGDLVKLIHQQISLISTPNTTTALSLSSRLQLQRQPRPTAKMVDYWLDSWRDLAKSFANERALLLLSSPHQRSLARTLVLSASGWRNPDTSNQYVRDLMNHMAAYIVDLPGKHDLKNMSQQPETIMMVTCLLERLRGAAGASEPRTQRAIYEMGFSVMNSLLTLLEVYKHEWVEGQIIYLEAQETAALINFAMRLLQMYSSHNIGKISLSHSSVLVNEEKAEKYKDLRALIQLLASLCSKDLIDFSKDPIESQGISIAEDSEVVDKCLRALKALASYHYKETLSGKMGLGSHAGGSKDSEGKFQEGILSRFLSSLLHLLLFEDYRMARLKYATVKEVVSWNGDLKILHRIKQK
ncbi:hypothetical protein Cgig2_005199 [Carnegiea gigantea]|uniref:Uncharacterized protein n=1 Tax=Carnegiea gigantea TaxID=171969 RepID=A0A9Q1QHR6_9CARY|nr:hypothetical protein Cgig2_005199 [Carnegiea gigantea]